jgi:hypothetical protein
MALLTNPIQSAGVRADIAESKDLSGELPQIVERLTRLYREWDSQMERPRWRALFMRDAPGPDPEKKRNLEREDK